MPIKGNGMHAEPKPVLDPVGDNAWERLLHERMNPVPTPEYVKPEPTFRQQRQTHREMEAGKKRVAWNEKQAVLRPPPEPEQGTMTPVFRPADHVPDIKKNGSPKT